MTSDENNQLEQEQQQFEAEHSSFAQEVWETLSGVDVNDLTEKKGNLTYLSWMGAWSTLMQFYPESDYELLDNEYFPDETMSVGMSITVRKENHSLTRKMWLQVLNYKNKPIPQPTSHDINNTRMRCLAKCVAMCGLASYIYMGHDLPMEEDKKPVSRPRIDPDERLNNMLQKMDECTSIGLLQTHFNAAKKAFKDDPDRLAKAVEKKDQIKELIEKQAA